MACSSVPSKLEEAVLGVDPYVTRHNTVKLVSMHGNNGRNNRNNINWVGFQAVWVSYWSKELVKLHYLVGLEVLRCLCIQSSPPTKAAEDMKQ